jgi:Bifunctional DNA primase/polymerase, N-terminal
LTTTNDSAVGRDFRLDWAAWWIALDAKVFVLAVDSSGAKVPTANCDRCRVGDHDMESCPCLLCHGFYSATDDLGRLAAMYAQLPMGRLAVRTGRASDLVVLDVEATNKLGEANPRDYGTLSTGVEILNSWEEQVGGWSLPPTLMSRSINGGFHVYLRYPPHVKIRTGGYVLPNVEVKSDGGYVAVPCGLNGRVLTNVAPIADMPPQLVGMLSTGRRACGGGGSNGMVGAAGGGDALPPTEEFEVRGLGWFTGSRNRDAYRLAFRLWAQQLDEFEVQTILKTCWDATTNHYDSSWNEIWRTAQSARRRRNESWAEELKLIESITGRSFS